MNTCRYTTSEKVGQVPGEADFVMQELDEKLTSEPPVALVVSAGDYEWLHGRDSHKRPPAVILGPWIDENYERVADIPYANVYVFKRKGPRHARGPRGSLTRAFAQLREGNDRPQGRHSQGSSSSSALTGPLLVGSSGSAALRLAAQCGHSGGSPGAVANQVLQTGHKRAR